VPEALPNLRELGADFNFVPVVFIAYVVYTIISSLIKAARQAQQAQSPTAQSEPVAAGMTADQVRGALVRRLAALSASQQQRAAVPSISTSPPPVPTGIRANDRAPSFDDSAMQGGLQLLTAPGDPSGQSGGGDLASKFAGLPAAAQAVVASAIIGPCAAHRGAGHQPEDW
jgi:hypothetical protein